jgi:mycothiol system anti-sigma-R factor
MALDMAGKDCETLIQELADLLHGEVDEAHRAELEHHLDDCPPCHQTAEFQAQLRQLVAERCCEQVPEALRARVVAMLRVEVSSRDGAAPSASP